MEKEKKKWETPKLICLYRGRPEEAVLGNCKALSQTGPPTGASCETLPQNKCKNEVAS